MAVRANFSIREATADDAADVARLNIDVWRTTYTGLIEQSVLDAMTLPKYVNKWQNILSPSRQGRRWCYVALVDTTIVGYACGAANPDGDGYGGVVSALYLQASSQGLGIGKALFECVLDVFRQHGITTVKFYVLKENQIGRAFYDRYRPDVREDASITIEGAVYCDMLYGWRSIPLQGAAVLSE